MDQPQAPQPQEGEAQADLEQMGSGDVTHPSQSIKKKDFVVDISTLTRDLEAAVKAVSLTKASLVKAQDVLDKAKADFDAALEKARELNGALQNAIAEVVPGLRK